MLFGFQLGSTLGSSFLNGFWTIHNPSNDVHYPAVTIQNSGLALAAYGVSGPALRPSGAYSVFSTTMAPGAIQIANQGMGVADGFTQYDAITGFYRPRWGDYSGAWTFNNDIYFTTEYIPDSNCSLHSSSWTTRVVRRWVTRPTRRCPRASRTPSSGRSSPTGVRR